MSFIKISDKNNFFCFFIDLISLNTCFLILSSSIILFLKSKIIFLFFASINGFFIGPVQSASRVFMTKSIDENNQASGFGLFAVSGNLTSFIGPLLVSTITFTFV